MKRRSACPDPGPALRVLKDFQRDTVEYVFRRLYLDRDATLRFLVADEVGLGKTLVARGVIAKAIQHLWDSVDRIDIIYVCSNLEIARQNVNRLATGNEGCVPLPTRVTLLPEQVQGLNRNEVNLISITPGTSLDLKSRFGLKDERVLLHSLLQGRWRLSERGLLNLLQGSVDRRRFRRLVSEYETKLDRGLSEAFVQAMSACEYDDEVDLRGRTQRCLPTLCERLAGHKGAEYFSLDEKQAAATMVQHLRSILARSCLKALEPDLVILDEFQRFKHLLDVHAQDEAAQLARELFRYADEHAKARVLLLSATPYKMYTIADEPSGDNHYDDFQRTIEFLHDDQERSAGFKVLLDDYRREVFRLADGDGKRLRKLKDELEGAMRRVMVRTERLATSENRNGMLQEVPAADMRALEPDLRAYVGIRRLARELEQPDIMEYWKSSPYLLNFMDEYDLKARFEEDLGSVGDLVESEFLLPWRRVREYEAVDSQNARLRSLMSQMTEHDAWRLAWVPPSLPYYQLAHPFDSCPGLTKRLVFSTWRIVPRAVAALMSYEVERRIVHSLEGQPANTPEERDRRGKLLRLSAPRGRAAGMSVLALLYPSVVLAQECDPLKLATERGGDTPPALEATLAWAENQVYDLLRSLDRSPRTVGSEDERWYWAAPILLDMRYDRRRTQAWWNQPDLPNYWTDVEADDDDDDRPAWARHVDEAKRLIDEEEPLGRQPRDLVQVLARCSLAAPATCALRSLARTTGANLSSASTELRTSAASIGWASRTLFNLPEVATLVRALRLQDERQSSRGLLDRLRGRGGSDYPYWRAVIDYCLAGCLQATLDEYAHVLRDSLGLLDDKNEEKASAIAEQMRRAMTLRVSAPVVDDIRPKGARGIEIIRRTMRSHAAQRLGDEASADGRSVNRADQVRVAFNSPFWPFVLATTSIGQEGLDFHTYCHAVVHWNLPGNPVDLEQREGRVHRYKGHAVRKNVARHYGLSCLNAAKGDPWDQLFEAACHDRGPGHSDIVPFWVYTVDGGAHIERHLPLYPLSREVGRLEALRRSLTVYRMVFGQARQEDLVQFLLQNVPEERIEELVADLRINLEPPHGDKV